VLRLQTPPTTPPHTHTHHHHPPHDAHTPQRLFPSPLYFFDEVDCALDTSAAARVAAYVAQQCRGPSPAQYLLVSHKPAVFEAAQCLLGVYSNGRGSSAAVVAHFADGPAAAGP
jgi:hypothetical protein